jgi:hypothetical protein
MRTVQVILPPHSAENVDLLQENRSITFQCRQRTSALLVKILPHDLNKGNNTETSTVEADEQNETHFEICANLFTQCKQ